VRRGEKKINSFARRERANQMISLSCNQNPIPIHYKPEQIGVCCCSADEYDNYESEIKWLAKSSPPTLPTNKLFFFPSQHRTLLSSALGKKFRDTFCRERGIPSPRFFLIVQINSKPAKRKSRIIYSNFLVSKVYVATLGWPAFLLSVHKARRKLLLLLRAVGGLFELLRWRDEHIDRNRDGERASEKNQTQEKFSFLAFLGIIIINIPEK
jgi:hypothetical protein